MALMHNHLHVPTLHSPSFTIRVLTLGTNAIPLMQARLQAPTLFRTADTIQPTILLPETNTMVLIHTRYLNLVLYLQTRIIFAKTEKTRQKQFCL